MKVIKNSKNWRSRVAEIAENLDKFMNHIEVVEVSKPVYIELKTTMLLKDVEEKYSVHTTLSELNDGRYILVIAK